jgi:hypothetical protein
MTEDTTLYCYVHPNRPTTLRCNNCERPICAACAVLTPTGYRCKECVRGQQKVFDTSQNMDYVFGFIVAAVLSLIASILVTLVTSIVGIFGWILLIIAAPTAGAIIAEATRYATRKHRSKPLFITVASAVVIGAIPVILFQLWVFNVFGIIFQVIYLALATPAVYTRLSGIQIFR